MTLWARYRKLNLWSKLGALGSVASIIGLVWMFVPQTPAPVEAQTKPQAETVTASPGATVIHSGRDTIINNPPPKTAPDARPAKATPLKKSQAPTAPVQTMINSPGGIQATGNVTVNSDRRVINSMTVRVTVETETPPADPGEEGTDAGLQSVIGLFTADKTRIRFATDFMIRDQQLSATKRRLMFTYTPETPEQVLGKPVDFLAHIDVLGVNYREIFDIEKFDTSKTKSLIQVVVSVNGIPVATIDTDVAPGVFSQGQANLNVAEVFKAIPTVYEAAVARR